MRTTASQKKPRAGFFVREVRRSATGAAEFARRSVDKSKIMVVDLMFDLLDRGVSRLVRMISFAAMVVWSAVLVFVRLIFGFMGYLQMCINFPRTRMFSFSVVGSMQPSFSGLCNFMQSPSIESLKLARVDNSGNPETILRNAYILSEFARLAYESKYATHEVCTRVWGFKHDNVLFLDLWGTQAFVVACKQFIVVSFRGAAPFDVFDWLPETKSRMRVIYNPPKKKMGTKGTGSDNGARKAISKAELELPKVHHGFMDALDIDGLRDHPNSAASWLQIREMILKLQSAEKKSQSETNGAAIPVFVTGHSLGAATATLFVQKMIEMGEGDLIAGLYTFGSPRCGNLTFAAQFNTAVGERCFRFVLEEDIVPMLPISERDHRCKYNPARHRSVTHRIIAFLHGTRSNQQEPAQEFFHVGNECLLETWPEPKATFRPLYPVVGVAKTKEDEPLQEGANRRSRRASWSKAVLEAPNPTWLRLVTRVLLPSYMNDHVPTDYSMYLSKLAK